MTYPARISPHVMSHGVPPPMVISYGDRVHHGAFTMHSRFRHAVNFECSGSVVSLVDRTVGDGPVNIVMQGLDAVAAVTLSLDGDRLWVGGRSFLLMPARRWISNLNLTKPKPRKVRALLAEEGKEILRRAPDRSLAWLLCDTRPELGGFEAGLKQEISAGVDLLFGGEEADGVSRLCGTGIGLTPSGDDFLVGHLAARYLLASMGIRRFNLPLYRFPELAALTPVLSRTALALAARGSFVGPVKAFVESVAAGDADAFRARGTRLLGMGSTSGADVATGILCTVEAGLS